MCELNTWLNFECYKDEESEEDNGFFLIRVTFFQP